VLQDLPLHEPQDGEPLPAPGFSTPLMPNLDNFFFTESEPHLGQFTA
jgi:hypothetical protein